MGRKHILQHIKEKSAQLGRQVLLSFYFEDYFLLIAGGMIFFSIGSFLLKEIYLTKKRIELRANISNCGFKIIVFPTV